MELAGQQLEKINVLKSNCFTGLVKRNDGGESGGAKLLIG